MKGYEVTDPREIEVLSAVDALADHFDYEQRRSPRRSAARSRQSDRPILPVMERCSKLSIPRLSPLRSTRSQPCSRSKRAGPREKTADLDS
jgi:hypothetical protein